MPSLGVAAVAGGGEMSVEGEASTMLDFVAVVAVGPRFAGLDLAELAGGHYWTLN